MTSQVKTYGKKRTPDASAALFDAAMKQGSDKKQIQPTRTSPRKTKSKYSTNKEEDDSDPYKFSPPESSKVSPPISDPGAFLEHEDSEGEMPKPTRNDSQSSLTGKVLQVHLTTPPRPSAGAPKKESPKRAAAKLNMEQDSKRVRGTSKANSNGNAPKATYRHRWNSDEHDEEMDTTPPVVSTSSTRMQKTESEPQKARKFYTSARSFSHEDKQKKIVPKQAKPYYTVIQNVRAPHQSQDLGENQQHKDDLEYILENLQSASSQRIQCLTILSLSKKCINGEFRQYLRAHGFANKIFSAVGDAWTEASLALCTSCVLYLLARDKLSLAVDEKSFRLLLNLMQCKPPEDDADYNKYSTHVWNILSQWCRQIKGANDDVMFDVTQENLSSNFLATEALVFVSTRKSEEWLKRDLRVLGGLEFIVGAVDSHVNTLPYSLAEWTPSSQTSLKLCERYLRIVEQATFMNAQNQAFLISHRSCALLNCCARLLELCHKLMPEVCAENDSILGKKFLVDLLSQVIRVLCNLSHDNELCCMRLGQTSGLLSLCLQTITYLAPKWVNKQKQFDLLVLMLGLLINLMEHCNANRRHLIQATVPFCLNETDEQLNAVDALAKIFLHHDAAAKVVDAELDAQLEGEEGAPEPTEQEIAQSLETALNRGSTHMEHSVAASYVALLLGCLIQQNEEVLETVKGWMENRDIQPMIDQLKQFLEFMQMTSTPGNTGHKSLTKVLELLQRLKD